VSQLLSQRQATVLAVVDEIAFRRLDVRIAGFLLRQQPTDAALALTHQQIAAELGTLRECAAELNARKPCLRPSLK
jgi:CRP/FNR family transcriptional regulator